MKTWTDLIPYVLSDLTVSADKALTFPAVNWECSDFRPYSIAFLPSTQECAFIPKENYFESISNRHTCQPTTKAMQN